MISSNKISNKIISGQFLLSETEDKRLNLKPYGTQPIIFENQDDINFDDVRSLMEYLSITNAERITNQKWNEFKGMDLPLRNKIRLNNLIWREFHMQCYKNLNPKIIEFKTPNLEENHPVMIILMEGKYWKRQKKLICSEYRKQRLFFFRNHDLKPKKLLDPQIDKEAFDKYFDFVPREPTNLQEICLDDNIEKILSNDVLFPPSTEEDDDEVDEEEDDDFFDSGCPVPGKRRKHNLTREFFPSCSTSLLSNSITFSKSSLKVPSKLFNSIHNNYYNDSSSRKRICGQISSNFNPGYNHQNHNSNNRDNLFDQNASDLPLQDYICSQSSYDNSGSFSKRSFSNPVNSEIGDFYPYTNNLSNMNSSSSSSSLSAMFPSQSNSSVTTNNSYNNNPYTNNFQFQPNDNDYLGHLPQLHGCQYQRVDWNNPSQFEDPANSSTNQQGRKFSHRDSELNSTFLHSNSNDEKVNNRPTGLCNSEQRKMYGTNEDRNKDDEKMQNPAKVNNQLHELSAGSPSFVNNDEKRRHYMQINFLKLQDLILQISDEINCCKVTDQTSPKTPNKKGQKASTQKQNSDQNNKASDSNDTGAMRISKAVLLIKASTIINKLEDISHELDQKINGINSEVDRFKTLIKSICEKLSMGISYQNAKANIVGYNVHQQLTKEQELWHSSFVTTMTRMNWKFYIFNFVFQRILSSYFMYVTKRNPQTFDNMKRNWLNEYCTIGSMRPHIVGALCELSKLIDVQKSDGQTLETQCIDLANLPKILSPPSRFEGIYPNDINPYKYEMSSNPVHFHNPIEYSHGYNDDASSFYFPSTHQLHHSQFSDRSDFENANECHNQFEMLDNNNIHR